MKLKFWSNHRVKFFLQIHFFHFKGVNERKKLMKSITSPIIGRPTILVDVVIIKMNFLSFFDLRH